MQPSRLAILSIGALIGFGMTAHAQDGVPMGPVMCLYGYGDYRACEDEPPPNPDPIYSEPVIAADPLQDYRLRYEAALQRLRDLVDGLQDIPAADPQSTDEMSARLSIIYTAAAFRLDSISAARNDAVAVRTGADADTAWQIERIQELQGSIATAAARKAAAVDEHAALAMEQHRLEAVKASLESHRADLAAKADQSAMQAVEWLAMVGELEPERPAVAFMRQRPLVAGYLPSRSFEAGVVPIYVVRDLPRLPASEGRTVQFRAAPALTVDELLSTVENLAPQIEAATQSFAEESPAAAQAEARANAVAIALHTTTQIYRGMEGEVKAAESRAGSARDIIAHTRQDCRTAALNMLSQAIEATLLNRIASEAKAAVKEFIAINGDAEAIASLTDEKVAALYRVGQVALHIPAGAQFEQMDKFLETQQAILAYVKNPLENAIIAGNALGNGDPNAGIEEAIAVFRGLRRDALEIAETATENLPAGLQGLAMRLLDDAD